MSGIGLERGRFIIGLGENVNLTITTNVNLILCLSYPNLNIQYCVYCLVIIDLIRRTTTLCLRGNFAGLLHLT